MSEETKEIARKYFAGVSKIEKEFEEKDKEIEKLQSKNKKIQTILRTRARQDRKRKAKLRKLRLETTNQRLKLERLHSIIKEVREYMEKELSFNVVINGKENKVIGYNKAFDKILEILDKES